jgi:hypothetical protein
MPDQNNSSYTEEVIQDLRALKIPRHRRRRIWKPFMEKYNCQVICEIGVHEADRFATAAFAMGREGINFIASLLGFEGMMIDNDGVATMTDGFEKYAIKT